MGKRECLVKIFGIFWRGIFISTRHSRGIFFGNRSSIVAAHKAWNNLFQIRTQRDASMATERPRRTRIEIRRTIQNLPVRLRVQVIELLDKLSPGKKWNWSPMNFMLQTVIRWSSCSRAAITIRRLKRTFKCYKVQESIRLKSSALFKCSQIESGLNEEIVIEHSSTTDRPFDLNESPRESGESLEKVSP